MSFISVRVLHNAIETDESYRYTVKTLTMRPAETIKR